MALKPTLSMKQTQTLALTPQLRQSLAMLRLPAVDLVEQIHTEALENPLLVIGAPRKAKDSPSAYDVALNTVAETVPLGESIRRQLAMMSLPALIRDIANYLTGDLSDTGYLETDIDETAQTLGVAGGDIETAIQAIQQCEPTGVGARNLTECLLLQIVEKGIERDTAQKLLDHTPRILDGERGVLSEVLGVPDEQIETFVALLKTLKPEPVANHHPESRPLVADIIVEIGKDRRISVSLSESYMPDLAIDTDLLEQAKADAKAREYIETQYVRAQNLIRAVRYRGETLVRIARAIVTRQHRFFIDGTHHMTPLTRRALADELSLHPSTIGRAIAGKNLELDGTLYPLSFFLGAGLKKGMTGEVSAYVVQQIIRRMIEQESPDSPLSDDTIVKKLRADGVDIARRTVAKYRGCMNIPSSFVRRKIAAAQQAPHRSPGHRNHLN
ncbi:RNA polymerase factor sigma-54 [Profundibacter sp.]